MKELSLVYEKDKQLRTKCKPFNFAEPPFDPKEITDRMFELMYGHKGVGLAATQVGLEVDLFVMGTNEERFYCFNPKVVELSSDFIVEYEEGCLSFPDLHLKIKRPETVIGQWQDENGKAHVRPFSGLLGRCFQHELDHLNGVLFTDHVSPLRRRMAEKKRKKEVKKW